MESKIKPAHEQFSLTLHTTYTCMYISTAI